MTLNGHHPRCKRKTQTQHKPFKRKLSTVALLAALASCTTGTVGDSKTRSTQAVTSLHNDVIRFLEQATFGPSARDIAHLEQDLGGDYGAWINEQFAMPISNYPDVCCDGSRTSCNQIIACGPEDFYALPQAAPADCPNNSPCRRDNYSMWRLQQIFYRNALTAPDQLRQRVFFALNQILVTSAQLNTLNYANRMTKYLRMLDENALGNFRQILYETSRNPTMGRYLDNIQNTRTQLNENYAREIMQLFSIGLTILNPDGTTDGTPSYTQDTVVELTRALTGWVLAPPLAPNSPNYRDPLVATPNRHDLGEKVLFAGTPLEARIPAGQSAETDLNSAIDILFNHPNVGPFLGKTLIQMFVTSNPSGDYVRRVTQAFNDNGNGVRGDMKAVIRQILMDPEARDGSPPSNFGKLREPVLAVTNLVRNVGYTVADPTLAPDPISDYALTHPNGTPTSYLAQGEDVFLAPTVFNFFPPDFTVPGAGELLGPEFGILSTATTLAKSNLFYHLINGSVGGQSLYRPNFVRIDLGDLMPLAGDADSLVEALNQQLLRGQMSTELRNIVANAISGSSGTQRVKEALFIVSSSSAYQVQR